jgi:perosamine synthetase
MTKFFPVAEPNISEKEIDYVNKAVSSGWVSSIGEYIDNFEKEYAHFIGTKYAISTSSGTAGLHLALLASGVKQGDEVIIPDFTFIATANSVRYVGAEVVLVDINPDTLCIEPRHIKEAITSKTKAVIPVHVYGQPANMPDICDIAAKNNIIIIEDVAEAHGADINGKKVGSLGLCGVFSFYGNKIITTGEGGMITTDNEEVYKHIKKIKNHGMSQHKRYWHDEIGFNYRMTNIQAALGLAQLERIHSFIKRRANILKRYKENLKHLKGVRFNREDTNTNNVCWMVCMEVDYFNEKKRDLFMSKLREKGVDSRPYFYPISNMPMYKTAHNPVTYSIYDKGVNLPSYFSLEDDEIDQICDNIETTLHEFM